MRHLKTMPNHTSLDPLDALKSLTPSQFEELIERLGVDRAHLSTAPAPLAQRATELLQLLRQQGDDLFALQKAIDDVRVSTDSHRAPLEQIPAANTLTSTDGAHVALRPELLALAVAFQWVIGRAHMELVEHHDTLQDPKRLDYRALFSLFVMCLAVVHPGSTRWPRTFQFARHASLIGGAWMVLFTYLELHWFRAHPTPGPFVWVFLRVGLPALYGAFTTTWASLVLMLGDLLRLGWRRAGPWIRDRLRS